MLVWLERAKVVVLLSHILTNGKKYLFPVRFPDAIIEKLKINGNEVIISELS